MPQTSYSLVGRREGRRVGRTGLLLTVLLPYALGERALGEARYMDVDHEERINQENWREKASEEKSQRDKNINRKYKKKDQK